MFSFMTKVNENIHNLQVEVGRQSANRAHRLVLCLPSLFPELDDLRLDALGMRS